MDPFIFKVQQRLINDKYHLVRKLGEGGCGVVYLGRDAVTGEEVALKLEHGSRWPSLLFSEFGCYKDFRSVPGFPRIDWYGDQDDFNVMIFELLGPSLEDVLVYCDGRFSLKTTLMLADQLLARLQAIHSRGYLHRDIKPSNFLLGTGRNGNTVYVTDLGLMEEFNVRTMPDPVGDVAVSRQTVIGTVRYASIQGHISCPLSPKDDLESLCYMLVSFMKGRLPWQGLHAKEEELNQKILDRKMNISAEELCADLPWEFAACLRYVKSMKPGEAPDYDKMLKMFRSLAERERIEYDEVYDWTVRIILDGED